MSALDGTYRLEGYELLRQDGVVEEPYGSDPEGLLVYSPSGFFSGHVMRKGVPKFQRGARLADPARTKEAFLGYIGYFGRFSVDAAAKTVTHRVLGSWHPNWVGTAQVRHFRTSGNRLLLETPLLGSGGKSRRIRLMWKRVGAAP